MRILLIALLTTVLACNNTQKDSRGSNDTVISKTGSNVDAFARVNTDFTSDSIINIKFPKDSSSLTVTGRINGINKPVTVNIPVTSGDNLTVVLTPEDSVANIRINQLFMPDGKADGPFGRSLVRKITQQGNYKVIIGENLMQGDEWKGKFLLTVKVE